MSLLIISDVWFCTLHMLMIFLLTSYNFLAFYQSYNLPDLSTTDILPLFLYHRKLLTAKPLCPIIVFNRRSYFIDGLGCASFRELAL